MNVVLFHMWALPDWGQEFYQNIYSDSLTAEFYNYKIGIVGSEFVTLKITFDRSSFVITGSSLRQIFIPSRQANRAAIFEKYLFSLTPDWNSKVQGIPDTQERAQIKIIPRQKYKRVPRDSKHIDCENERSTLAHLSTARHLYYNIVYNWERSSIQVHSHLKFMWISN